MFRESTLSRDVRPPFAVHLSTLLAVLILLVLFTLPSAAQLPLISTITVSPGGSQIWNAGAQSQVFTVTVPSGTTLGSISALTLGAPNLDFTIIASPGTAAPACAAGTTNTTCSVNVQFTPMAAGRRAGALVINDSNGNNLVNLSIFGMSLEPMAGFAPGIISTFAGNGASGYSGDGGPASSAKLGAPTGTSIDGFGNLYIADTKNNVVRKVTPSGAISTFAGTRTAGFSGDNGLATAAQLNGPMAVLVDNSGWVFIADTGNHVVRLVNGAGIITTYAGQYYSGTTLPAVCTAGNTVAGYSAFYIPTIGDGCLATQAVLATPVDLIMCHAGNLHILDQAQNRERTVFRTAGVLVTQVGSGTAGYNGDGMTSVTAELNSPTAMDMDAHNYIYIADTGNHAIRRVLLTGTTWNNISTIAGTPGTSGYTGDGKAATAAELNGPCGLRVDGAANVYVNDCGNNVIRMVNAATGNISTIAGKAATKAYTGDGGPSTVAELNGATGLEMDKNFNLYIADTNNNVIRKIDVSGAPLLLSFDASSGQTSTAQDVTLLNMGSGATSLAANQMTLLIDNIFTPPNFTLGGADTTCKSGQSLVAGGTCILGVEFKPTTSGPVNGQIAVVDNSAIGALQTVAVTGNSQTASYTVAMNTPSVSMVTGGNGTTTLNLTSNNFTGTVSFVTSVSLISGSGSASAVTASATPVVLTAGGTGSSTVTISSATGAANHAPKLPWKSGSALLCAVLLGGPFTLRRKRAIAVVLMVLAISLAVFMTACGSSSPSARTYAVTLTPTASTSPAGAMVTNPGPMSIMVTVR